MATKFGFPLLDAKAITVAGGARTVAEAAVELGYYRDLAVMFLLSAAPTGGSPTLNVWLQHSMDNGTTWQDFVASPQFTNAAATKFAFVSGAVSGGTSIVAASDAALTASTVVQGPWGDRIRAKWTLGLAGGESGQYTLSIWVVPKGGVI